MGHNGHVINLYGVSMTLTGINMQADNLGHLSLVHRYDVIIYTLQVHSIDPGGGGGGVLPIFSIYSKIPL